MSNIEKSDFIVECLRKEDEDKLFDLLERCFGGEGGEFFKWKYKCYPGLKLENTVVVKSGDGIIGAITLWPMKVKIGPGRTLDILVAGGAVTHPSFRRRGIWWKYMERARSLSREMGASLLTGYVTSETVTYRARVAHGIRELFTQHYFMKILNYSNFFKSAIRSREFRNITRFSKIGKELKEIDERIQIVPDGGSPFTMVIRKGEIKISDRVVENPTMIVKGDICMLIFAKGFFDIFKALLARKVRLKVPIHRIRNIFNTFKLLRSLM